jgi:hypothetical protein
MATLTTNLKLRIPNTLDADSRYNLQRIDTLGATGLYDSSGILTLRSISDISLRPGSGSGGEIKFNHKVDAFRINATTIDINSDAVFTGGFTIPTDNIDLSGLTSDDISDFDSAVSGNTDVAANTAHRNSTTNPHNVTAAQIGAATTSDVTNAVNAHSNLTTGIHGVTGSVVGTTDTQVLTNKTIVAASNTITGLADANIAVGAAIDGTKVSPNFGSQDIVTNNSIQFSEGGYTAYLRAAQSGMTGNIGWDLPVADGTANQVLITNGSGKLDWATVTGVGGSTYSEMWTNSDGASKTVTHSFGTRKLWTASAVRQTILRYFRLVLRQ